MADMMEDDYEDEDQVSPQQAGLTNAYLESSLKRKAQAEAQMQKLLDALNVRKNMPFDPVLMRVAGAMLAPTKTGSFGESLGYATTAAADEAEKQAMRNMELAKYEFELNQKLLQQQEASDALRMAMEMENAPQAAPTVNLEAPRVAAEVPAVPLPDAGGITTAAVEPVEGVIERFDAEGRSADSRADELLRMAAAEGRQPLPVAAAPAPAAALPPAAAPAPVTTAAPAAPARRPQMVTPSGAAGFALKMGAPTLYEFYKQQEELGLKRQDIRQKGYKSLTMDGTTVFLSPAEQKRLKTMQDEGNFEGLNKFFTRKFAVPPVFVKDESGEWRAKTTAEKEREKAVAVGIEPKVYPTRFGPISMLPEDFLKFRKIDELDPDAGERFIRKVVQQETKPTGGEKTGEKPKIVTEDVRKEREQRTSETMKEDVKQSAEQSALVQKRATEAFEMREIIDNLDSTAKYNRNVFGLLQGPGVVRAIARAIDKGTFNVKIEDIAQYKLSRKDQLALQDAANNVARLQNMIRKGARIPGEGTTSDLETRMQIAMSLTTSMSPEIIRLRAEVMRERANFDEKVFELWSKYKKTEKGYFQEFLTESNEYKDLKKNYENKLKTIRDANAEFFANPTGAPRTSAPSGAAAPSGGALQKWNR